MSVWEILDLETIDSYAKEKAECEKPAAEKFTNILENLVNRVPFSCRYL
jgi:hypothetical protein